MKLATDVYSKETKDLLVKVEPPFGSASTELQTVNLGNVTNRSFELALNARLIEQRRFTWAASANFAQNINRITRLRESNNMTVGNQQEKIYREDESVGSFYGFVYEGVDAKTGDIILSNLDDNPKITTRGDHTILGSIQPDFTYGFSTSLTCRGWDLFVSLQGSQGNEVYNKL